MASTRRSAARWLARLPAGIEADLRHVEERWETMRFANGTVHQPHVEQLATLSLRVRVDGRLATATSTAVTPAGFDVLARRAIALARAAPPEPKFPGFAGTEARRPASRVLATAPSVSVEQSGRMARDALEAVRAELPDGRVSGAIHVGRQRIEVATTAGLDRTTERSVAQGSVLAEDLARHPAATGWAEGAHFDPRRLDATRLGTEAARRVARAPAQALPPGRYPVILRPPAVAELLSMLAYLGFGAHGEIEGWSCLARQRGRRIAPASVTVVDDATSSRGLPQGIDYEGVGTARRPLIDAGVARGPVLDLVSAGRLGGTTTGHAPPPESPTGDAGPIPTHLEMAPGDASEEEMVRSMRRGVIVTRFHYVRVVHSARSVLTGMTRDGTYLVERGEVTAPVHNLRFTESILATLAGVEAVGRTLARTADERGYLSVSCPALASRAFRFTSATVF
jgi:PmbA protein